MPYIAFDKAKTISGVKTNTGSVKKFAQYLEKESLSDKETKRTFFNNHQDDVSIDEVIETIDSNIKKLGKDEAKFYSFNVSPSKKELLHINNSDTALKEYVRELMDIYAKNFYRSKLLSSNDIVYFAKIEDNRYYKGTDDAVKNKYVSQRTIKPGMNKHIHIIVSRKDKSNTMKLSPKDNARGGDNFKLAHKEIKRGFPVKEFKEKAEDLFDTKFKYIRANEDKFNYLNLKKNHPEKFNEKYKFHYIKNKISIENIDYSETLLKQYITNEFEKAASQTDNKTDFVGVLQNKGIKISNNQVIVKDKSLPLKNLSSSFNRHATAVIVSYYLSKKFISKIEKEKSKDKEEERKLNK